jgi:hypothetical protein
MPKNVNPNSKRKSEKHLVKDGGLAGEEFLTELEDYNLQMEKLRLS